MRERGVTLIELMTVLVIVAVLASIALTSYRQYAQRAGRSEAKVALLAARQNLERCFTRFSSYLSPSAGDCPTSDLLLGAGIESGERRYVVTGNVTATTYTLTATPRAGGGMTDDSKCTTLTITQLGQQGATGSAGAAECWR